MANTQAHGRALVPANRPRPPRRGAQVIVLAWFSLGVLTSGAMGAGAIVGLRGLAGGGTPAAGAAAVASWAYPGGEWDTVQLAIDRSQRSRAPFPLQVTGADDAALELVMHGFPAGVRPSRGVPVGAATWLLRRADLDGLHLTLNDDAPAAFDVRVAVLTALGTPAAGSIVKVRLVDAAGPKQTAAAVVSDTPHDPLADAGVPDGPRADLTRPTPASTPAPVRTADALREPEPRPSWWRMPPPNWSPFVVGQERP